MTDNGTTTQDGTEPAAPDAPQYEDGGVYQFNGETGTFEAHEPPQPLQPGRNPGSGRLSAKPASDNPYADLDKIVGKPSFNRDPWADIAGEV